MVQTSIVLELVTNRVESNKICFPKVRNIQKTRKDIELVLCLRKRGDWTGVEKCPTPGLNSTLWSNLYEVLTYNSLFVKTDPGHRV